MRKFSLKICVFIAILEKIAMNTGRKTSVFARFSVALKVALQLYK